MLKKIYKVAIQSYDYFCGQKYQSETFDTAAEAIKAYKKSHAYDFNYIDDGYRTTYFPTVSWKYEDSPAQTKHGHVYGFAPTDYDKADFIRDNINANANFDEWEYWANRCTDLIPCLKSKKSAEFYEKEFPVFGWDGEIVDTFTCVPGGALCSWYCNKYGYYWDTEGFHSDDEHASSIIIGCLVGSLFDYVECEF